jgi:hypothetical protein
MRILLVLLAVTTLAVAQVGTIGTGTRILVRTSEMIEVKKSEDRVFAGVVDVAVRDANGTVAIPRGAHVDLVVRELSNKDLALDLESLTVSGRRYAVATDSVATGSGQKDGIGSNKRTAEYVGGGALLGTIIGAIAGGGKGAAIGAAAGAGAGAGTQVLTRGKTVRVPAESLLTFRLEQPLQMRGQPESGLKR